MKKAEGTTDKWFLISGGLCYAATFYLLTMALKYLPMGYTNAIWAGTSTILVYFAGMLWFKEKSSLLELFFVFCIITGVVGLNILQKGK